jgi:hypothetical protein
MRPDTMKRAAKVLGVELATIAEWACEQVYEDLGVAKPKRSR